MKTRLNDDTSVRALIEAGALQPHFQPICNIRSADIFGYESLIRGPDDSPLKFPDDLFSAARSQGCEIDLELHCAQVAIRDFTRWGLPGKIFINMSAAALLSQEPAHIMDRLQIAQCSSLPSGRIVIELTEHVRVATDAELRRRSPPLAYEFERLYGPLLSLKGEDTVAAGEKLSVAATLERGAIPFNWIEGTTVLKGHG